ncbi:MAG: hypothetical protein MRY83_23390 [Flavobacteriales bacterium]|nr:hypothetical protein [Flavobacteriales bacterium]
MRNITHSLLVLLSIIFVASSCKKKDEPAPDLPPESTFIMNFDFTDTGTGKNDLTMPPELMTDKEHFLHAALNGLVWNGLIFITAAVPVAAFRESFNHEWEYDRKDEVWSWPYDVTVGLKKYNCRLEASLSGENVIWEMYVSQGSAYTDFLWYEGISALNGTTGTWTLYKDPQSGSGTPFIHIDWERRGEGDGSIKYTNVIPGDEGNGGYIYHNIVLDTTGYPGNYNAQYDIYNKASDQMTEILWNTISKHGRVRDGNRFGDDSWHCWNTSFEDEICD